MKQWRKSLAILFAGTGIFLLGASGAAQAASEPAKGAKLAADPAAKDLVLKGDAKCTGCHDEADEPTGKATMLDLNPGVLAIGKTKHGVLGDKRTPTCTDCHGESEKHRTHKGSGKPPAVDRSYRKGSATEASVRSSACMSCHKGEENRFHWDDNKHARNDVACNSCHKVHTGHDDVMDKKTQTDVCFTCHKEQRAELKKMSVHPVDSGKIVCSSCHNPHGSSGPAGLRRNTVNETCFTCHAEKRGPFLWEHLPVAENCATCHTPHGSNIGSLLRARPPFMCTQCHDGPHSKSPIAGNAAGLQGGLTVTPSATSAGRACMDCHIMVHGSNSPAGAWLHR